MIQMVIWFAEFGRKPGVGACCKNEIADSHPGRGAPIVHQLGLVHKPSEKLVVPVEVFGSAIPTLPEAPS
jgi:hypothetical protein